MWVRRLPFEGPLELASEEFYPVDGLDTAMPARVCKIWRHQDRACVYIVVVMPLHRYPMELTMLS